MNNFIFYGIITLLFAVSNIFAQQIHPPANPDDSDPNFMVSRTIIL